MKKINNAPCLLINRGSHWLLTEISLDKLLQRTWWLRGHTLRNEFLLSYIVTRRHLYILLHQCILMILKFVFHALRAASIFSALSISYDSLIACPRCGPLIINSCHILIGLDISTTTLHHLVLLSLFAFVTTLLLSIHLLHLRVWIVRIRVLHEPSINISSWATTG